MFRTKRIYEAAERGDGFRVLVDRLWPRGVSKADAKLDLWLKDVAPSNELRRWFGHRADRFDEFRSRYLAEIEDNAALEELRRLGRTHETVTLLYAARDTEMNQAVVLAEALAG
jgi:uncharacterized protein YeaO (DUF488 family)